MGMMFLRLPILACLASVALAGAAESSPDTSFQRLGGVPVLAYSEETGWQFGALGMLFLRSTGPGDPGGQVDAAVIGTTKSQVRGVVEPTVYFMDGRLRICPEIQYRKWPGKFWPGGNSPYGSSQSYDMDQYWVAGSAVLATRGFPGIPAGLGDHVKVGAEYDFERNQASFQHPDSVPALRMGGLRNGLGWSLQWDDRDHDNWPRNGSFAWVRQVVFSDKLGSDWNFVDTKLDLRTFFPAPLDGAWAMAAYWEGLLGNVPFDRLAMPDGTDRLRGLVKGRLRDRQQLVFQGEARAPLFWRFGGVLFAEAGKVGPDFGTLLGNQFHYSIGAGGRLILNTARKVSARGDLSWVDGGLGMTIYYKEAF